MKNLDTIQTSHDASTSKKPAYDIKGHLIHSDYNYIRQSLSHVCFKILIESSSQVRHQAKTCFQRTHTDIMHHWHASWETHECSRGFCKARDTAAAASASALRLIL